MNSYNTFKRLIVALALIFLCGGTMWAQQSPFNAVTRTALVEPVPASPFPVSPSPLIERGQPIEQRNHHFWDRDNEILFATLGAINVADFWVTRNNLALGGQELNPLTRPFAGSTAGLAVNFAGETMGYIGVSYFFHKTGHHKLERMTSFVDIGGSAGAVAWGLTHR